MKDQTQKWHSSVLQTHNAHMFESNIYPHNVFTETPKTYQFEDERGMDLPYLLEGYLAKKEVNGQMKKFFIDSKYFQELPIRVNNKDKVMLKESARIKSIVYIPTDITPFRIKPGKMFDNEKQFVDEFAPFEHSVPKIWTLNKMIAIMSFVGKTFMGVCSNPEFGKSSAYTMLDAITRKCPVFQPRSAPGVLVQITGDGNMVFDDIHATPSEVKRIMENFSFDVGSGKPVYINGAIKSSSTKSKYDVSRQSITYLFNRYEDYSNPEKTFWDNIWDNPSAMKSRFLCVKFEGKLLEQFDKGFNIVQVAKDNKMYYINVAKHLLYLKQLKLENGHTRKWVGINHLNLSGRHQSIYDEVTWLLDLYCKTQVEYDVYLDLFNRSITKYHSSKTSQGTELETLPPVVEEMIVEEKVSPRKQVVEYVRKHKEVHIEQLLELKEVTEPLLRKMISEGDLFEVRPGIVREL
jgi:hypothetical protein